MIMASIFKEATSSADEALFEQKAVVRPAVWLFFGMMVLTLIAGTLQIELLKQPYHSVIMPFDLPEGLQTFFESLHLNLQGALIILLLILVGLTAWKGLNHILEGHAAFYLLIVAVVMLDHVHIVFRPYGGFSLSRVMKGIKGVSSRLLNEARKTRGAFWRDESYDRIVRNDKELIQKIQYVLYNPVRAGFVEEPFDYEFLYYNEGWEEELRSVC